MNTLLTFVACEFEEDIIDTSTYNFEATLDADLSRVPELLRDRSNYLTARVRSTRRTACTGLLYSWNAGETHNSQQNGPLVAQCTSKVI